MEKKSIRQLFDPARITISIFLDGEGGVGITKTAFENYTEIIALIFAVCRRANSKYTMANCLTDLKYSMCKNGNAVQKKL